MWEKIRVYVVSLIILIVMLAGVLVWNKIINKDKKEEVETVDVSDVNNVKIVDSKLSNEDYRITQSYLMTYTVHKAGTWYYSKGYVSKIKYNEDDAIITISESKNSKDVITGIISKDKCNVKVGDTIYFVGTVSIKNNNINLTKIDTKEINYNSVTNIEFMDLKTNLNYLKNTYFVISGYMITDGEKYKLFDSKDAYGKSSEPGTYFLINWDGTFDYTGNQDVKIRCQLADTYKLKECSLVK